MAAQQDHVLLPVADLDAAKARYYEILKDLNYTIVGEGQHRQISGNGSKTVEFGPLGTSRVDLVLSQSDSATNYRRGSHPEHVVFPAMERHVVRDFYAHALDKGFKAVRRPEPDPETGMLTTTVRDIDGNQVEVRYEGLQPSPAPGSSHINNWISSVNGDTVVAEPEEVSSTQNPKQMHSMRAAHGYPARTSSVRASSARRSSGSVYSDHRSSGGSGSGFEMPSGKTVVGTLLGAAAGAALAYTMVHARDDSKMREAEHEAKMEAKERVKAEARRSRYSQPMPIYNDPRRIDTAPPEYRDRDSGYQSGGSGGWSPPDADGRSFKYRSVTYPGPVAEAGQASAQNSYRDRVDQKRDLDVRSRRSSSMSRHSSANSESTVRPARSSSLRRLPFTTLDPPRVPSSLPPSMAPPSIPSNRGRRMSTSHSTSGPPPAASAQTSRRLARSRSRSQERRDKDRGSRDRDGEERYHRRHSVSSHTRYSQVDRSKPPPTAMATAGARTAMPSEDSPPPRRRSSSARPSSNDGSISTARRVPLPASETGRSSGRSNSRRPTTTTTTYRYDRPPSPTPSAALTEKALRDVDQHSGYQPTGSKLDDLGSVAPGDSISVVGTQPRQPPPRDFRGRKELVI